MKKIFVFAILLLVGAQYASAQSLGAGKFFGEGRRNQQTLPVNPPTMTLILLPSVPVTFTSLAKDSSGKWQFSPGMGIGIGSTFVYGRAMQNGDMVNITPLLIGGLAANIGVKNDPMGGVKTSLTYSEFIGLNNVAVAFSHDILDGANSIGLSLKMDILTDLAQDTFWKIF